MAVEGDWEAVGAVVADRMAAMSLSLAEVARQSGLSETTIRYLGRSDTNRSTLEALGAALLLPLGYLWSVAQGKTPSAPGATVHDRLATIERKLDALCDYQLPPSLRVP